VQVARLEPGDERWAAFVESRSEANVFHHPSWSSVIADTYGFRPFTLALERPDGSVAAGMPVIEVGRRGRRWVSLPFTDACAPLADEEDLGVFLEGVEAARAQAGVARVEIRAPVPGSTVTRMERGVLHTLALRADPDELLSTFSASQVRRNIARATREEVTVSRADGPEGLLETFYRLHLQTRRRQGVPIQPRLFFDLLWERILRQGHGFVLVAHVGAVEAAAAVFLHARGTLTYKFGASDPRFWPQRPNHLLFWEAIRWGCEHGFRELDFGRSDPGNAGLRAFKSGWGTVESELVYTTLGTEPKRSSHRAEEVLAAVIRRSPTWVCRVLGEKLYRYAG
jgi:CelD/BcsL family acetyltransferase involved in cellulose biosynthesis